MAVKLLDSRYDLYLRSVFPVRPLTSALSCLPLYCTCRSKGQIRHGVVKHVMTRYNTAWNCR